MLNAVDNLRSTYSHLLNFPIFLFYNIELILHTLIHIYMHIHMCDVWIRFKEYKNIYRYTNLFLYKLGFTDKCFIKLKMSVKILFPK